MYVVYYMYVINVHVIDKIMKKRMSNEEKEHNIIQNKKVVLSQR